ncbi:formate dehydrogenase [Roseateles violae]|uniref:Formate dehydrogenase n=1 Tax=Roseateles violae TaxID=3058042 RepID=A0ABT8DNE5_9BURK|nr:formate dehydrogenase [Pelomonas sp. PFR6]MDN3919902.1 formate dehydrogenase [Pelomonas sp. PFR6]
MSESKQQQVSRRRLFAGAGAAGALAGAAVLIPRGEPAAPVAEAPKPAPEAGGGYQLTEHVMRYYQTAKV